MTGPFRTRVPQSGKTLNAGPMRPALRSTSSVLASPSSVNGNVRESRNDHWLSGPDDAKAKSDDWRQDYYEVSPYGSRGTLTPSKHL